MADGRIEIDTKINTDGAKKGVNELSGTLGKLTKGSTVSSVAKLGAAATGVGAAFLVAAKGVQTTAKAIKEVTQAYKIQLKAETQLEAAAKNNPYLDKNSVKELKEYASQLQSISTVGDEQLLPFMSQLAASGRTQTEIQKIMQTALDMSATGMISLDSAVQQLNGTFSGSIGLLGKQNAELKNLSSEEIKNGKALDILAGKYKGISEEVAKTSGSTEQLQNAWGDLKEELGEPIEKGIFRPFRQGLTNVVNDTIDHIRNLKKEVKDVKEEAEKEKRKKKGQETAEDVVGSYEYEKNRLTELKQIYSEMASDSLHYSVEERAEATRKIQTYTVELAKLEEKNRMSKIALENAQKEADLKKQQDAESQKQAEADAKAQSSIDKYLLTVKNAEKEIELRKKLGEQISQEDHDQEMLNVKMQAYIQMIKDAEGTISGNKGFAKSEADRIAAESERLGKNASYDDAKNLVEKWQAQKDNTLEIQKAMLDDYAKYLAEKGNLTEEEIAMQEKIKTAKANIDAQMQQDQKERFAETISQINDYFDQFADITQSMTSLIRSANEKETEEELSNLSKQYTDGLISYEEYCDKKEQIDREAAQREYKLKMWEWTASLLTATSNIAQGISKAIADGGVAGIVSGALVGVAGAVQIATLMANKPQPPSFATGGFLTGNSTHGDKIAFKGNAGESILNPAEMRTFMAMANGEYKGSGSVVNMPVKIENNAAGDVSASAKMTEQGLRITIDRFVGSSMQQGRYNQAMTIADNKKNGVSVL